jgi:hypothetical protein
MKNACPVFWGHLLPIGGLLTASLLSAMQPQRETVAQITESAQQALKTYTSQFVTRENATRFGFRSPEEASRARLGTPLPVALISLTDLKAFKRGAGTKQLLTDTRAFWYPVMVGDEVRAKLEMTQKDSRWIAGEFGATRTATDVGKAEVGLADRLKAMKIEPTERLTLVRVPSLNATLLLAESPSGEYLVPVSASVQKFGLEGARVYPAEEVLERLSEFAQGVDAKKVM